MGLTKSEKLTLQFYEWERCGRGWYVFDKPVLLEPIFTPFVYHGIDEEIIDTGRQPSIFGKAANFIQNLSTPKEQLKDAVEEEQVVAYSQIDDESLCIYKVIFPETHKQFGDEAVQFVTMLAYSKYPISFEIVATYNSIAFQIVCRESDSAHVYGQLQAYYPECIVQKGTNVHLGIMSDNPGYVWDFGLKDEFMCPLSIHEKSAIDPYKGFFGIVEHLQPHESVTFQLLFHGIVNAWAESIMRSVTINGESFFADAPEFPKLAQKKVSLPLFGVVIRLVAQSKSQADAEPLLYRVTRSIKQMSDSDSNSLLQLSENGYPIETHVQDILTRLSHRGGMLLNAGELATFVRFPSGIASKKLEREVKKTKPSPPPTFGHDFILGRNIHQGVEQIVTLEKSHRLKHMHVIGATGTGKSTLLEGCIVQDILLGNGVALIDPHGDLLEGILPYIPEDRYKDVILIDPSDSDYPIGFNILSATTDIEKEILASDLVATFRRLSTSWGDQMNSVLANAILAFVESNKGGTLIDLRRFLIEKPFRDMFLKTVTDPSVVYYWQHEYPLLKSSSIGSILTRLDTFIRPKAIRNMIAQRKGLNFEDILDSRKILLVKLSQGLIGTDNAYLLGTVIVSKLYQAAMARQAKNKVDRKEFFLYIDEFQNFICPSLSTILSGTRKYGLGCVLVHQDLVQIQKHDAELASAVISNAGTRICFRLGDTDAKRLSEGFSSFEPHDIQNLGIGEAIVRVERPEYDFSMSTLQLNPIPSEQAKEVVDLVIACSREQYATARAEVEKTIEYLKVEKLQQEQIEEPRDRLLSTEPQEKPIQPIQELPKAENVEVVEMHDSVVKEELVQQKEVTQHRQLQMLIKKMGQDRGYKSTIEETISDGAGRIDVSLEKNGNKIACEIGMTTTKDWEVHNIKKCLDAGYTTVVAIAKDAKAVRLMQKKVEQSLAKVLQKKVYVFEKEEFFLYLDKKISKEAATEERIKGYTVKVEYEPLSEKDMQAKKEAIAKAILKRNKK